MSSPRIQIPPALVAEGKRLFEETNALRQDIAAVMGISPDTLRRRSIEWGLEAAAASERCARLQACRRNAGPVRGETASCRIRRRSGCRRTTACGRFAHHGHARGRTGTN